MAIYKNIFITENFLEENPNAYFVFGDNLIRKGMGGAAALRHHPRAIGFITKKKPDNKDSSFYKPEEYQPIFLEEIKKLEITIEKHPEKIFYISQIGGGLANRYRIWEKVIKQNIVNKFKDFHNVVFCW